VQVGFFSRLLVAQPFWLRWRDDADRSRRHAPDLFARMADGSGVVIDVRPARDYYVD
jgi:hypothetical protein